MWGNKPNGAQSIRFRGHFRACCILPWSSAEVKVAFLQVVLRKRLSILVEHDTAVFDRKQESCRLTTKRLEISYLRSSSKPRTIHPCQAPPVPTFLPLPDSRDRFTGIRSFGIMNKPLHFLKNCLVSRWWRIGVPAG